MKRRVSLSAKILLLAFFNLFLLAVAFRIFAFFQFRFDLGSALLAPARDRITTVSRALALELPDAPKATWNEILARYSASYPAKFYLFSREGDQLAGDSVALPGDVKKFFTQGGPFRGFRRERTDGGPPERTAEGGPPPYGPPPDGRPPGDMPPNDMAPPNQNLERRFGPGGPQSWVFFEKTTNPSEYWAAVRVPIWFGQERGPLMSFIVWRFDSLWTEPFFFDVKPWLGMLLATIAISIACWLPFIRGLSKSISELTRATGQIAEGRFDIEVPVKRSDELGWLSASINRMAHRLAGFVDGQRRFLGDIAHELCTPIARIQLALGILEQRAAKGQAEYVADLQEEVQHMSSLVNELLSFSKAQLTGNAELSKVNVAETVQRVLQREADANTTIENNVAESIDVLAQPDCLFRSLANVVRNAIRYAGEAGPIAIAARNGGGKVSIIVSDNGPGVPDKELDEIFKPFYRPEFARQRETGGVGLGLAIVKSCVEACGGVVMCRNRTPKGFEVEIQLTAA